MNEGESAPPPYQLQANNQPASLSSDAAEQFCETNPPRDQTGTGDRP